MSDVNQYEHVKKEEAKKEIKQGYINKNQLTSEHANRTYDKTNSKISNSPGTASKFKVLSIALLRVIIFSMGAVLILGIYTAFVAPLNPIRFIFMIIGVILMSAYSWLIVFKFKGGYSAASTVGQLCISFLLLTYQFMQYARTNPTDGEQASIFSKIFIGLLIFYIVLKARNKTKKN
jgi:membrane-bound ClpP family serine protease